MEDKGKAVGVWLNGEGVLALKKALEKTPYLKEGTYCAEADRQRLNREGHLKTDRTSAIAARATELVDLLGAAIVEAKLNELAAETIAAGGAR